MTWQNLLCWTTTETKVGPGLKRAHEAAGAENSAQDARQRHSCRDQNLSMYNWRRQWCAGDGSDRRLKNLGGTPQGRATVDQNSAKPQNLSCPPLGKRAGPTWSMECQKTSHTVCWLHGCVLRSVEASLPVRSQVWGCGKVTQVEKVPEPQKTGATNCSPSGGQVR